MQQMSEIVAILLVLLVSVSQKKKNIFSNFSIFAFFCSNIFFFYIFWCMENYKSILLLSLPLFYVSHVHFCFTLSLLATFMGQRILNEALISFLAKNKHTHRALMFFFYVWFLLIYTRRSSSYIYQKLFPTRVLAFPKSYYFPCLLQKVLVENIFFFVKSFLSF